MTEKTEKRVADTINIVTYVANDGTEFVSKDSCLAYEEKLKQIEMRERECERKLIDEPFEKLFKRIPCAGLGEDVDIFVGYLKSAKDYSLLDRWIDLHGYCLDWINKPQTYPTAYVFCITDNDGYPWTMSTTSKPASWIAEYLDALNEVKTKAEEDEAE